MHIVLPQICEMFPFVKKLEKYMSIFISPRYIDNLL